MKPEITSDLKSIEISYRFAKQLEHGISYKRSNWRLFEPSKFIYSFFAFNMVYEIDWPRSFSANDFLEFDSNRTRYAKEKIYKLVQFLHKHGNEEVFLGLLKEQFQVEQRYDTLTLAQMVESSRFISRDKNITKVDRLEFLKTPERTYLSNFIGALNRLNGEEFGVQDHYFLLIFCYQVRNNIFHGTKKATQMKEDGQRLRLLYYSQIILATLEMFFRIAESKFHYNRADEFEIKENAGVDS